MRKIAILFAASLSLIPLMTSAEAATLTYSEKAKKVAPYFDQDTAATASALLQAALALSAPRSERQAPGS